MLKISHISKTFNPGTVNEKKALEDFSLELNSTIKVLFDISLLLIKEKEAQLKLEK